jgi:hypothetical protein
MSDEQAWRSIPLIDVDWGITGCTGQTARTGTHSYVPQPWPRSFP